MEFQMTGNDMQLTRSNWKSGISGMLTGLLLLMATTAGAAARTPIYNLGYIFTTHHTPLIAAMARGERFGKEGAYLRPVVEKMKYELVDKDTPLATFNIVVSKSGSETATLFAMNRMDMALASGTAIMSGIDKGTDLKMVCPLHVDGLGLVFPRENPLSGWDAVLRHIRASERPVRIGYHSPTSAPRIVLEGALKEAGLAVTQNPTDADAEVLLVDLKSTANFIPALMTGQVDAWVGPAPHPEVSVVKGMGHIALDLRDLPPEGKWHNFPCCVMAAQDALIAENPVVVEKMVDLMTRSAAWCNTHKGEAGTILSGWIGVPEAAVAKSAIIYTTTPSPNWMAGEAVYLDMLDAMNKFKGRLKGKSLEEVTSLLFDFRFVKSPARS